MNDDRSLSHSSGALSRKPWRREERIRANSLAPLGEGARRAGEGVI